MSCTPTCTRVTRRAPLHYWFLWSAFTPEKFQGCKRRWHPANCPLITITKLQHRDIGMKGNTSCAQVQSTWNRVLPNLPAECNIILRRSNKAGDGLTSTWFCRDRIQRALELLKNTSHLAWQIDISEQRLPQWPVEGDLMDLSLGVSFVVDNNDDSQDYNTQDSNDNAFDLVLKLNVHPL